MVKPVAAYESDAKKAHAVGELGATVPWPLKIGSHSWSLRSISSSPPTALDHTSFFCAIFISISSCTVTALSERRAEVSGPWICLRLA